VNVDGSRLKMAELIDTVATVGYPKSESVVASGNLIVWSDSPVDTTAVTKAILDAHGFTTEIYMRSEDEVRRLPKRNPFSDLGGKVEVAFLPENPTPEAVAAVGEIATGPDLLRVVGTEIFWWRPVPLQPAIPKETALRRALGTTSTRRTLGTVARIIARLDSTPL
jgi:uncharacterized protein (DUF1697 family)